MPITMRDVAVRARTSVATVSKCLHGVPTIPASTRERVRRIAEQMGYRLHPFISALMRNRRKRRAAVAAQPTLAYVTAYPTERGWQIEAFFRALYTGARTRAEQRGYLLSPFWLHRDGMSGERFCEVLCARGISGMLFNPFPAHGAKLDLPWAGFSVVAHGLSLASPIFHRTSNDHHQSMMLAMQECRRRGYRRPGFTLDEPTTVRLEYRWEGAYMVACAKLGFELINPLLLPTRWRPDDIVRWARRERVDVVIGLFLEEQIADLARRGIGGSSGIGLLSLSVAHAGSPLSGIRQNPAAMGAVAVDQLINMVERHETGIPGEPVTLTIEGVWNEGRTVRGPQGKPAKREMRRTPTR
ncbi:MAG: LacI family DNA-binding transcriptional regulator [Verrucomicrobia bacterium]|nr:LacI family DNA-binding transcriptional regulator [Verrucomicrobiota bacterium]